MAGQTVTTKELSGLRAVDGKKGKRIGKVRRFVFHPTERRVVGLMVKRPDAALMFRRKDLFVKLDGFHLEDDRIVVSDDAAATDKGAIRSLGVEWDACVIWVGMPVMTKGGELLGYVGDVAFDRMTGEVISLTTENGVANDAILGKRAIPGKLVRGFKRGMGAALAPLGEYNGEDPTGTAELGAILVSDAALDIESQGGAAAAAGKASAVVADKAKKGASAAKAAASEKADRAKPTVRKVAEKTGQAVEAGAFAAGKQLGKASGMFAAFKEEFDKASRGDGGK